MRTCAAARPLPAAGGGGITNTASMLSFFAAGRFVTGVVVPADGGYLIS